MSRDLEPRARLTPPGPPNGGRVLEFRRSAVKPRRRRRSLWAAAARGLLGAILVVGTPVAAAAWAMTSPRFALTELEYPTPAATAFSTDSGSPRRSSAARTRRVWRSDR